MAKSASKGWFNFLKFSPAVLFLSASILLAVSSPALPFSTNANHPAAGALTPGQQVVQVYAANGSTWVYLCYLPYGYDNLPNKKWPMILYQPCQSGMSSSPFTNMTDPAQHCSGISGLMSTPEKYHFISDSFVVVTPWVGDDFNPSLKTNDALYAQYYPFLLAHVAATVRIDTLRINLMANCEGSCILFRMVDLYPQIPASFSVWGLWTDPANPNNPDTTKLGLFKNIPMNFIHGGQDANPWQHAKMIADKITAGGNPNVHWYFDASAPHEVWIWSGLHLSFTDTLWYPWMLAQKRSASPTPVLGREERRLVPEQKSLAVHKSERSLTISGEAAKGNYLISVNDILGRCVLQRSGRTDGTIEIAGERLRCGTFIVKLETGGVHRSGLITLP
jgi:hypothetical protein